MATDQDHKASLSSGSQWASPQDPSDTVDERATSASQSASPPSHSQPLSARRDPPRKRNRAALSCVACRERKIKCNRQVPCDQCMKRGDADLCFLDPYKRGPPASQSKSAKVQAQLQAQAQQQAERDRKRAQEQQQQQQQQQQVFPGEMHPSHSQAPPPFQQASHSPLSHTNLFNSGYVASPPRPGQSEGEVEAIKARLAQVEALLVGKQVGAQPPSLPYPPASQPAPSASTHAASSSSRHYTDSEVDAIKNRLAQLEAVLTGNSSQTRTSVHSDAGAAMPSYSHHGSNYSSSALPPLAGMLGASSPAAHTTAPWRNEHELSRLPPLRTGPHFSSGHRSISRGSTPGQHSAGEDNGGLNSRATPHSVVSNDSVAGTSMSQHRSTGSSKAAFDSDTEDAAMVLEGLAMSGQAPRKGVKSECPQSDNIPDPVAKEPQESLIGYVARNKEKDIMLDVSQGGTSGPAAGEVGYCGAANKACTYDEGQSLEEMEEMERNGVDVSPAKKVCTMLRSSESLFRPIYGPESFLGFGMGWALPAAEAAKDLHVKGGECPGSAQREAVLRAIIRSLPRRDLAAQLVSVYADRVNFLTGNVIHMPSFRKEVEAFYALETVERQARVVNNVDPGWLAVFLLAITLALRFYPCTPPAEWQPVTHLFDGRSIHMYASAARTALVLARFQSSQSLAVLQAILLSNLSDSHAGRKVNHSMLRIAISNAQEMGLHRLGDPGKQPRSGESTGVAIRREVAKRIWYQLVFKDWTTSVCTGVYAIQERQFNTPLPGNYNDEDLEKMPLPSPRPREEHTDMSYSLESIEIVKVMKLHTDMQNERKMTLDQPADKAATKLTCADASHLDAAYRSLLTNLPSFFAVGSEAGTDTNVEIQRWLIQQVIFHHLLKLHRPALSSKPNARTSCVALARSILDTQKKLRSRCTVVDRLISNLAQSYTAAIVLLLDLMQNGADQPPAMRQVIRSEVAEAVRALQHVNETTHGTEGGIRVIEALLAEEESRWNAAQESALSGSSGTKRKRPSSNAVKRQDMLSLANRIARAVRGEEECKSQAEQVQKDREVAAAAAAAARPVDPDSGMQDVQMSSVEDSQKEASKDALSRALMEQLFVPHTSQQGGNSGPNSMANNGSLDLFSNPAFASLVSAGGPGFESSNVAPNGVEADLLTGSDGAPFDLNTFLAQYESPRSSSSNSVASIHSTDESLSNGSSFASSSGYNTSLGTGVDEDDLRHQSSRGSFSSLDSPTETRGQKAQLSPGQPSPAMTSKDAQQPAPSINLPSQQQTTPGGTDPTSYGLDAFYNWVLSQGLNVRGQQQQQQQQQQSQLGQGQNQPVQTSQAAAQQALRSFAAGMNNSQGNGFPGQQGPNAQGVSSAVAPDAASTGYTPFLAPFGGPPQNVWASSGNVNDPPAGNGARGYPAGAYDGNTSSNGSGNGPTGMTPLGGTGALNTGTPSASVTSGGDANLSSWLNGPGLFDFGL